MLRGVTSSRVVLPSGVAPATVLFAGREIEAIVPDRLTTPDVLDAGSLVVSPGLVDTHVHVNEPGRTEWEGFRTATRAAAAGGVTTLVDMPLNSSPVTTTREALYVKVEAARPQAFVDVGFWGGVVPGNARHLRWLVRDGVFGAKAFMVPSGIDEFPAVAEADLREAMTILQGFGLPLLAHAELDLGAPAPADPRSYAAYVASRPRAWEDEAIRLLVRLCRETRCAVHVVHLASASAVQTIRGAKAEGLPVTAETCPHYLFFQAEAIPDGATVFKCAPPIRDRANREALWAALLDGTIDGVVSDHSPCPPSMKCLDTGDFTRAWGGIASLQHGLSIVWTEASRRGAGLEQMARWMSEGPARIAGVEWKGRLEPGYQADIVVWDPAETFTIRADDLHYRHKISPYVGATVRGRVRRTLLGGREVFDGHTHTSGPAGRALHRRRQGT